MPIEPSPKNQAGIAVLAMQRLPIGLPVAAACFLAGPVVASANSALRRFTGIPLFDPTERFRMEKGQPCDRVQLGVPWAWHIYSARLGDTRFGKISCGAGRRRRLASEPHQLPHARLRRDACPGPRFRRPWPGHDARQLLAGSCGPWPSELPADAANRAHRCGCLPSGSIQLRPARLHYE